MDLTRMIVPKSDQKNADDFLTGPQTFTVTDEIEYEDAQQPAGLVLDGDTAHPYKPCKSMGRVLMAAWGKGSWVGRSLTLYNDPAVRFGGQETGGIRISHMSHITKPLKLNLTLTKGKRGAFTVQPLVDPASTKPKPPVEPTAAEVAACTDTDALRAMWPASGDERRAQIRDRVAELTAAPAADPWAEDAAAVAERDGQLL